MMTKRGSRTMKRKGIAKIIFLVLYLKMTLEYLLILKLIIFVGLNLKINLNFLA